MRDRSGRLPNFLIVGAAKAGTTTLFHWLGAHPEVFLSPTKEIHFFDRHWGRGTEWYANHFAGAASALAVGEATPYMAEAAVASRMAAAVPEARLVAVLRNPVDRAYSHYWHMYGHRAESRSFAEAVEAEERGDPDPIRYLADSRYLPQLERLSTHFSSEQMHVLLFEDIKSAPRESLRRIARFIGVDPDQQPANLGKHYNAARRYRSIRVWRLQLKYQRRLRIPARVGTVVNRMNTATVSYPALPSDLRARLSAGFAEHNKALGDWIGRDLSGWDA